MIFYSETKPQNPVNYRCPWLRFRTIIFNEHFCQKQNRLSCGEPVCFP